MEFGQSVLTPVCPYRTDSGRTRDGFGEDGVSGKTECQGGRSVRDSQWVGQRLARHEWGDEHSLRSKSSSSSTCSSTVVEGKCVAACITNTLTCESVRLAKVITNTLTCESVGLVEVITNTLAASQLGWLRCSPSMEGCSFKGVAAHIRGVCVAAAE